MENKKRLIYAEDAKNLAIKLRRTVRIDRYTGMWPCLLLTDINEVPTVDAVEVVHGKWEHNPETGDEVCSNCGFEWWDGCQECGVCPSDTFYCPNCGAKMDGVNKDG